MSYTRILLTPILLTVLLESCSAPVLPIPNMIEIPSSEPTMIQTTPTSTFIILAYATDGIITDLIPYDKLTHINYSFLTPKADGTFNQINNSWKLKKIVSDGHEHDVKVLISVGGWGWDQQFETVAADPSLRSAFVQNLKTFLEEYQLDGADVDWEYPDAGQSAINFLALMQELRLAMPDKLFTTAVVSYGENGLGILPETFKLFDFVNVMAYDGPDHGSMEQFERGLLFWTERGLPPEKIVMGIPFYGDPSFAYFKIVQEDPSAAQRDSVDYYGTRFLYNGIPTVQAKTTMAMNKAGGIMFWALDFDAQGEFSLVNAIYRTAYP